VAWLATIGQKAQATGSNAANALGQATSDATEQARQTTEQLASGVRDRVAQAANDLQHNGGDAVARAQAQIGQEFAQLEQLVGKNPWLIGALALGVGIAIGVALPETEQERALYGQARDALGSQVQSAVHGVLGALTPKAATTPTTPQR